MWIHPLHLHRWAAKEAVYKAGAAGRLQFPEIEIVPRAGAAPEVRFHGGSRSMIQDAGVDSVLLSISHDADAGVAVAFATALGAACR